MEDMYVLHIELLGFERRFFPSQHYVYMLLIKWSDQSEKLIYRRYPEMHTFHKSLKEMFPIEAGDINIKDRIIPSLPAPKWFDTQRTTETRQGTLAEYCQGLINLPPKISRCRLMKDFFTVRPDDEIPPSAHPFKRNETYLMVKDRSRSNTSEITGPIILESYRAIADYSKSSKYELEVHVGDSLEIVEKNANGWWFCQCDSRRGWLPASYLEPLDGPDEAEEPEPNYEGELYITTKGYTAVEEDELSLEEGETIEVIHKLLDGWWVVRKGEDTGHFPSMFLHKTGQKKEADTERTVIQKQTPPPRRNTIRNVQSIHSKGRSRISQDTYRRNSRRYLQHRGPQAGPRHSKQSPLMNRRFRSGEATSGVALHCHGKLTVLCPLESNPTKNGGIGQSLQSKTPVIPPRPSTEVILQRCTEDTRRRVVVPNAS